jgi:hypothetical protein
MLLLRAPTPPRCFPRLPAVDDPVVRFSPDDASSVPFPKNLSRAENPELSNSAVIFEILISVD